MSITKTLIIAEAGVNHNGDLNKAKELIDVAAESGADLVKFQTFSAKSLVTRSAAKAEYQKQAGPGEETQFEMLSRLELSREDHQELFSYCQEKNIGFCSTGFDEESVAFLLELGINVIKIPSGDITNYPYLKYVGGLGLPIILSTGMSNLGEIEAALAVLMDAGTDRSNITVLHCNTEYPTPCSDVNLRAMNTIQQAFDVAIGYSDHTLGIEVPVAAVALGASVIEKHFTLDRNLPGPDHKAALEPDELKDMVTAIRNIELALGSSIKTPSPSESKNKAIGRRSIIATKRIEKGEQFTVENLSVKRPGTGISAMRWEEVLGRKASRCFEIDEMIEL